MASEQIVEVGSPLRSGLCILKCGCISPLTYLDGADKCHIPITSPDQTEIFKLPLTRVHGEPAIFVDTHEKRPVWAEHYHVWIPLDPTLIPGVDITDHSPIFNALWEQKKERGIPQCWLADFMAGRSRFLGVWDHQLDVQGRVVGHLKLVE